MKHIIYFFLIVLIFLPLSTQAQVKVGDNPSLIDASSILELESQDKVFVLTRISQSQMNSLVPLPGAMVYNIDAQCIYAYDGIMWKSLCDDSNVSTSTTAPTDSAIGDIWFDSSTGIVSVWDGTDWLPININPRRGVGAPDGTISNPLAGDIYVDEINGDIYTYNGTDWVQVSADIVANNGLTLNSNIIQLGGNLIQPTIITTTSVNTLAIEGLEEVPYDPNTDNIVIVDNTTGVLRKTTTTAIVNQEQVVLIADDNQIQFTAPPLNFTNPNKVDVYRNGVRIDFTIINNSTIELEPEAICYQGDEIRIVQLN